MSYQGQPAMLKLAMCDEERLGNAVMAWWNGSKAAARILAQGDDAIIMLRAESAASLAELSRTTAPSITQTCCATRPAGSRWTGSTSASESW
uniref:aminoglycoside phosphotransferase family protein n=1 Tax=Cupriavidus taiwanensis TaxID=164546 RepID=UPI00279537A9|nr:aminoglycoside phosphotransferase family protein [Cupriavidus taiwanensis]